MPVAPGTPNKKNMTNATQEPHMPSRNSPVFTKASSSDGRLHDENFGDPYAAHDVINVRKSTLKPYEAVESTVATLEHEASSDAMTQETNSCSDCMSMTSHEDSNESGPSAKQLLVYSRQKPGHLKIHTSASVSHDQANITSTQKEDSFAPSDESNVPQAPSEADDIKPDCATAPRKHTKSQRVCDDALSAIHATTINPVQSQVLSATASPSSGIASASPGTPFDVEAHVRGVLTRSTTQNACDLAHPPRANEDYPNSRIDGFWPSHQGPCPTYWAKPASLYSFPDQLAKSFPPDYHSEPYASFAQQRQYDEPLHIQSACFEGQLPDQLYFEPLNPACWRHAAMPAAPANDPDNLVLRGWNDDGCVNTAAQKPWYLQPLLYEEEKEREFEARGPSRRMRLMKVCRKYGL